MTYEFTIISFKTKKGGRLYLGIDDSNGSKIWVPQRDEAIYFDTENEAQTFGEKYFIKFNKWELLSHEQAI